MKAPGQDVIVVRPGDDLAAIISAPDRQYETVYLVAGEYTVTADAAIPIARNLELYSDVENPDMLWEYPVAMPES